MHRCIVVISLNLSTINTKCPSSTENIEMKGNESYNVTSPNTSPIPAGADRPVSELEYHYVRTDPLVTIRSGEHKEGVGMSQT